MLSAAAVFGLATAGHAGELSDSQAQQLIEQNQALSKRVADLEKKERKTEKKNASDAYAADLPYKAEYKKAAAPTDDSITFKGVTVYGLFDLGVIYQTHGVPLNNAAGSGLAYLLAAASRGPYAGLAPNALSSSFVGIRGKQEVGDDLFAIFNLQSGFNPESGTLANGVGSISQNNGVPLALQSNASDSAKNGQAFNNAAYFGLSSPIWGTVTLGRQSGISSDNVVNYDPQHNGIAFSLIGFQGYNGGGGDTQQRILDNSIEYKVAVGPVRFAAEAQLRSGAQSGDTGNSIQADIGFDYAGFSFDFLGGHEDDAVQAAALSAAQVAAAATGGVASYTGAVAGTVSDNTFFQALGKYSIGQWKFYAGYENVRRVNPSNPLATGSTISGGFILVNPINNGFLTPEVRQTGWVGATYAVRSDLDLTAAYYHEDKNSFAVSAANNPNANCTTAAFSGCSGQIDWVSFVADWRFAKRFDLYAGLTWQQVSNGLAAGFIQTSGTTAAGAAGPSGSLGNRASLFAPTAGLRFQF
jgi:predicted porin